MIASEAPLLEIIEHLSQLSVYENYSFDEFLKKLLKLIARIVPMDSGLIYLYDRSSRDLILIASQKPKKKLLGKIVLKKGEGITGWVADHKKTVAIGSEAYKDKRFKQFEELPEDRFEAFLSVPIMDKHGVIGVLNVQHREPVVFTKHQIRMLESVVKIIAAGFERVVLSKKVTDLESKMEERKLIEKAKGVLMQSKKITEDEAYSWLRAEAMKRRKKMRDIAEAALIVFGNPDTT